MSKSTSFKLKQIKGKFVKSGSSKSGSSRPKSGSSKSGSSSKASARGPAPKTIKKTVKKEDALFDLEQHFVLRLPPGPAIALRRDVESGAMNLKDKLSLEIGEDGRHSKVTYGGQIFNAKMMDLPAIVETLKTTDRKTFYKCADICQMLVCQTEDDDSPDENETPKKKDKDKKYQLAHGITAPLKNVRKRRFRKTLKKKYQDQPDIEKEVKRLFRMDNEAIDVKWEVVIEDSNHPKGDNDGETGEKVLAHGETTGVLSGMQQITDATELSQLKAIFGDVSSSDEDDKDINIMDSGEEDSTRDESAGDFTMSGMNDTNMSTEGDSTSDLHVKLQELGKQLEEIQDRRSEIQIELSVEDDLSGKEKLEGEDERLQTDENSKKNEFEILKSMLNQ